MSQVRELMTPLPVKVPGHQPIQDCARILWRLGVRHLPVVDSEGRSIGIITDFDLLQHGEIIDEDGTWMDRGDGRLKARDLARTNPVECQEFDDLYRVVRELCDESTDVALVIDSRRHPVGILTEHDVVRWSRLELPDTAILPGEDSGVVSIDLYAPALSALDAMIDRGVRHLLVTDDGAPVGVVSWRDLVVEDLLGFKTAKVRDVLPANDLIALRVGATWLDVANTMASRRIGFVPLLDEGGQVAMVLSRTDIMTRLAGMVPADSSGG